MRRQLRTVSDRGAVTAELAVALPAVVLALAVALWGVGAAGAAMRCADAARAGARAAARGESPEAVQAAVRTAAPRGADVVTSTTPAGYVTVEVRARVAAPGPILGLLPGIPVRSAAVAAVEAAAPSGWAP